MQYRLYIPADEDIFCDPDNILRGARSFFELRGEGVDKSFEKIRASFPYAVSENPDTASRNCKRATVYVRNGRNDRLFSELLDVIALVSPKSDITVRCGREFYFAEEAHGELVKNFLNENVNSYVFSDKYLPAPSDAYIKDENLSVESFCSAQYDELITIKERLGIKMAIDDLMCVQNHFIAESREPSYTELKIIDSFFSESFRHTTFETILDNVESEDENVRKAWQRYRELRSGKMPSLSDITVAAAEKIEPPHLARASKKLVGVRIESADENEQFIIVPKNESHNRSVTAVPYDGAAGAVGAALKDLFCAFGYAYDSYRVMGRGKSENNRKKAMISAAGYADTASLVGVPCNKCKETLSELYNEKQLEVCSVLAVTDGKGAEKRLSKEPLPGDKIYLIGGKTGADGVNSAHLSLKSTESFGEYIPVTDCGELSAMRRLFARADLSDITVAVNDVGSGGIVCALGEIVSGADINLNAIKLKYGGISCADIVLSESNERMLVCVRNENCAPLESICKAEGVDYACIATVSDDGRFTVHDGEGHKFVALSREFLLNGGAEKHLSAYVEAPKSLPQSEALTAVKAPLLSVGALKKIFKNKPKHDFERAYLLSASKINTSKCELNHVFNRAASGAIGELGTLAASREVSVSELMYGGRQVMGKDGLPVCSALSCATLPEISKLDPYKGAYLSVCEAVVKLKAAGCTDENIYLSLQEYFPEHKNSSVRLGVSVASMLGVFEAQMQLGIASIGGRISIGSGVKDYEKASSVTAFAFCVCKKNSVIGSCFKETGSKILFITPELDKDSGLPMGEELKALFESLRVLKVGGYIRSAACVNARNATTVLMEMCRSGKKGVLFDTQSEIDVIFGNSYCSVIAEVAQDAPIPKNATVIGTVTNEFRFEREGEIFELAGVVGADEKKIPDTEIKEYRCSEKVNELYGKVKPVASEKVKVLIPDTGYTAAVNDIRAAFLSLGAEVRIQPVSPDTVSDFVRNLKKTDILWLPDCMGGSGFMTALLSDKRVKAELDALRERKGLIYGSGSSVESLIMSGLLELDRMKASFSRDGEGSVNETVKIRTASAISPFLKYAEVDNEYLGYVSGKCLKLLVVPEYADELAKDGRIATQYVSGFNAPGSTYGIDSLTSADGLVLGQLSRAFAAKDTLPVIRSAVGYFFTYNTYDGALGDE